jgi:hypothetical protein
MSETAVRAPSAKEVDKLVEEFAAAQLVASTAGEAFRAANELAGEVKARLVAMVEAHGFRHTEKSKRLAGLHTTATTTTATRVSIDDAAVEHFRGYLAACEFPELAKQFFVAHTSYSLVQGPGEVLKGLELAKRVRTKIAALVGLCFQVKTNAPSLKIDVAEAVKP